MKQRSNDYPTGDANGMSFICNRWVFTGPQGYRVVPVDGGFQVMSYTATGSHCAHWSAQIMTALEAHEYAANLSRRPVNPEV